MLSLRRKTSSQEKLLISKPIPLVHGSQERQHSSSSAIAKHGNSSIGQCSWRPITLRPLVLFGAVILSLCLALALHLLLLKSNEEGGIFCLQDISDVSVGQDFAYLYLPVAISVVFGIAWGWIDVDIKRMEPFFQLSKPGGVSAEHSLLLEYPYDFIASVPLKALRLGHWSVFGGSVAIMLIYWAVTPSVGAIFNMASVTVLSNALVATEVTLLTPIEQTQHLNAEFFNLAYGILWLDLPPPAFTTRNLALLPFTGDTIASGIDGNTTITASTTLFSVDLTCNPAVVTTSASGQQVYSNGNGCFYQNGFPDNIANYTVSYIGWYPGQYNPSLAEGDCSANFSNTFLVYWNRRATSNQGGTSLTIFCEPNYYEQDVMATVSAEDSSIIEILPLGPQISLNESKFNSTDFSFWLNTAPSTLWDYQPGSGNYPGMNDSDIIGLGIVDQSPRLADLNLGIGSALDISPYAFGLNSPPPDQIDNSQDLAEAFQRAYQVLFSMAISTITVGSSHPINPRNATVKKQLYCVTLDQKFTPLAEMCLIVVAAAGLILCALNYGRSSSLSCDPTSIMELMKLIHSRSATLRYCDNFDLSSNQSNKQSHAQPKFKISNHSKPKIEVDSPAEVLDDDTRNSLVEIRRKLAALPMELSTAVGGIWVTVHLLAIVTLCVLKLQMERDNGLSLPSNSLFVQRLILNYIPTAISTFLEPFWVLVNRTLCLLQPFEDLRQGYSPESASLSARYTAAPPQMALWRALKTRHFLLALVCAVSLLANVLAVTLSGLFQIRSVAIEQPAQFKYEYQPLIEDTESPSHYSQFDVTYTLQESMAGRTKPPPWTDNKFAYLPFSSTASYNASLEVKYQARSRGFGLQVTCSDQNVVFNNISLYSARLNVSGNASNGTTSPHSFYFPFNTFGGLNLQNVRGQNLAAEAQFMVAGDLYQGWFRYSPTLSDNNSEDKVDVSFSSTFIRCEMALKSIEAFVTVDSAGYVLNTTEVPGTQENMDRFFAYPSVSHIILSDALTSFAATPEVFSAWHTSPIALNWVDYIIKEVTGPLEAANVNPDDPVPQFEVVGPLVEQIYQQLFAVNFGYNFNVYLNTSSNQTIQGTTFTTEERVYFTPRMFEISLSILVLDLIIAVTVYTKRPKKFLPYQPTSIARVAKYFAHSQLLDELSHDTSSHHHNDSSEILFGFGEFIGTDGKVHIGIERHPFVTPLSQGEIGLFEKLRKKIKVQRTESQTVQTIC